MIHPTAIVDPSSLVHPDAEIGPGVAIGPRVVIYPDVRIGAYSVIGSPPEHREYFGDKTGAGVVILMWS